MTSRNSSDGDSVSPVPTVADYATKLHSLRDMQLPAVEPAATPRDLEATLRAHQTWVESVADTRAALAGRRACLAGCDLRGANLSRRDLRGADLSKANLEGAVLQGARLILANLRGANLKGADLRGAKLKLADLSEACLDGADLTGAVTD